ncbi:MAG TPA: hypothetical protein VL027_02425 [Spongiibacteraceae bacterium]|nr:hypothetical protein [Spongiibacteraceae bacterium]
MNTQTAIASLKHLTAILALCALAACGGGGGGGGSESTAATDNPPPPVAKPAPPAKPPKPTTPPPPPPPPAFTPVTISLSWQIPTTREDGSTLSMAELGGYQIVYYRDGSAANSNCCRLNINNGRQDRVDVTINEAGTWYFAISAIDAQGLHSDLSEPVSLVIN